MTLIEIMIALLIGAFMLGGVLQIFISTKQSYRMQEGLSRVQENGRFAMEFLAKDIRMADFWGCTNTANIENKLNSSAIFNPFASGVAGTNDDNGGNDHDADNDENTNSIWDGTDTITLRGAAGIGISVVDEPTATNASIKVSDDSGLAADEIVIISNCTAGDIFQITNVTESGGFDNVIHNTSGTSSPGNASQYLEAAPEPATPDPHANLYGPDAQILKLNFVTYKIANGAGNQPALFRSINGAAFQELVEGVEDMQILYGPDTNADNTPDYYVPAGTVGLNMDQVVSIRISLLARSIEPNLTSQPINYTINGATTTPTDNNLRRVFTSTIAVRNRLP